MPRHLPVGQLKVKRETQTPLHHMSHHWSRILRDTFVNAFEVGKIQTDKLYYVRLGGIQRRRHEIKVALHRGFDTGLSAKENVLKCPPIFLYLAQQRRHIFIAVRISWIQTNVFQTHNFAILCPQSILELRWKWFWRCDTVEKIYREHMAACACFAQDIWPVFLAG